MKKYIYPIIVTGLTLALITNHLLWSEKLENEKERVLLVQQQVSKQESSSGEGSLKIPLKRDTDELILNDIKPEYLNKVDANFLLETVYSELKHVNSVILKHREEMLHVDKEETKLIKKNDSAELSDADSEFLQKQMKPSELGIIEVQNSLNALKELSLREDFEIPKRYEDSYSAAILAAEQALRYLNSEIKYLTEDYTYDNVIKNKNIFMVDYNIAIEELNKDYEKVITN